MQWAASSRLYDRFMQPMQQPGSNSTRGEGGDHGQPLLPLFHTFISSLDTPDRDDAILGSGFDEAGRSKARIWFNALPHAQSGGWIINYNFFYVSKIKHFPA